MHTEIRFSHADLMSVESPGRYTGGEKNQIIKEDVIAQLKARVISHFRYCIKC